MSNDLGTQVIARKPLPRSNGRAKEASIPVGDGSVTLTTKTVELNRKGPRRLPLVQLDVSFTSADTNWKPVEFPLAIYERVYDEKWAVARGKGVTVTADENSSVSSPRTYRPARLSTRRGNRCSAGACRCCQTLVFTSCFICSTSMNLGIASIIGS